MLFSSSKLIVILIIVQSVISVEFYKNKRVRPKYTEIRRKFSLKNNEENFDSTSVNPIISKESNQEQKIDNEKSINNDQLNLTRSTTSTTTTSTTTSSTTTTKYLEESSSSPTPMSEEESVESISTEPNVKENDDTVEKYMEVDDIPKKKQPGIISSTVKPKRRPFNLRIMKNRRKTLQNTPEASTSSPTSMSEKESDESMSTEPNVKENDDIVEKPMRVDDFSKNKQSNIITTTEKPKGPFSLRIMKNRRINVQNTPVTTSKPKETEQQTSIKKTPFLNNTVIKPISRTFNVRPLGIIVGKSQSRTLLNKNANKDKASVTSTESTIKPESSLSADVGITKNSTSNLRVLENRGPKIENKPVETVGKSRENPRKILGSAIRNIEDLKTKLVSSPIKPLRRTLNLYSLKNKKENVEPKPIEKNVEMESDQEKLLIDNKQAEVEKKLSPSSITVTPKTSGIENIEETNYSAVTNSTISSTEKNVSLTSRLGTFEKEAKSDNKTLKVINNKNQEISIISDGKSTEDTEITTVATSLQRRRRPLNIRPMNNRNIKTEIKSDEKIPVDGDAVNQSKIPSKNQQIIKLETPDTSISTSKAVRPTTDTRSSIINEENNNSKLYKTEVDKNTNQDKVSRAETYKPKAGDRQSTMFPTTSKHRRRTLRLESLIINDANTDEKKTLDDNVETEHSNSNISPVIISKSHNLNTAPPADGGQRFITLTTQRKIRVQKAPSDVSSALSNNAKSDSVSQIKKGAVRTSQPNENHHQQTTPYYAQLEKTTPNNFIPIVGVENYVYAYNGDYHYSYEGGDGTKAFERGELKSADGLSNASGVVGGFSYKDKDGKDISLSYTAGEGGYRPVGAHLPTPPPIPPAIQRVLRILATKTTPEPVTESIERYH